MMIDRRVPYVENVCAVAMFMSPIKAYIPCRDNVRTKLAENKERETKAAAKFIFSLMQKHMNVCSLCVLYLGHCMHARGRRQGRDKASGRSLTGAIASLQLLPEWHVNTELTLPIWRKFMCYLTKLMMDQSIVQGGDHSSSQRLQRLLDRGYPSTIERAQRGHHSHTS
jgi:hypothetical protein